MQFSHLIDRSLFPIQYLRTRPIIVFAIKKINKLRGFFGFGFVSSSASVLGNTSTKLICLQQGLTLIADAERTFTIC